MTVETRTIEVSRSYPKLRLSEIKGKIIENSPDLPPVIELQGEVLPEDIFEVSKRGKAEVTLGVTDDGKRYLFLRNSEADQVNSDADTYALDPSEVFDLVGHQRYHLHTHNVRPIVGMKKEPSTSDYKTEEYQEDMTDHMIMIADGYAIEFHGGDDLQKLINQSRDAVYGLSLDDIIVRDDEIAPYLENAAYQQLAEKTGVSVEEFVQTQLRKAKLVDLRSQADISATVEIEDEISAHLLSLVEVGNDIITMPEEVTWAKYLTRNELYSILNPGKGKNSALLTSQEKSGEES